MVTDVAPTFVWAELPCAIHYWRDHWNGYVGVPPAHPAHGKDYNADLLDDIDVHGGLTYANSSCPGDHWDGMGMWWFGFDTAHYYDMDYPKSEGYVAGYCKRLAEQLAQMMTTTPPAPVAPSDSEPQA